MNFRQAYEFIDDNPAVLQDLFELMGQRHQGAHRSVYFPEFMPNYVIKLEDTVYGTIHHNAAEWRIWSDIEYGVVGASDWLAPCVWISTNGRLLIQRRTSPALVRELPERVPSWLTDLQPVNWGWLDGRIVCHDYSSNLLVNGAMSKRMKKADWNY